MRLSTRLAQRVNLNVDQSLHFIFDGEGWVRHHERPPTGILTELRQGLWAQLCGKKTTKASPLSPHIAGFANG